jgi:hypothetical protein
MSAVRLEITMERDMLPFVLMFLLGVALIIVGQVGEHLGWWDDLGLWTTGAGLLLSVVALGVGLLFTATKPQAAAIAVAVHTGNRMLGDNNRVLGEQHRTLADMRQEHGAKLDRVTDLLRDIRDRL